MQGRPVTTLEQARDIVRHYRLDQFVWGALGSTEGFANMLYCFELVDDLETVCSLFDQYRQDCQKRSTAVVDAEFTKRTHERQAPVPARAAEFKRLAEFVRSIRFSTSGASLWSFVAELATIYRPEDWFAEFASEDQKARLLPLLDGILQFKSLYFDSPAFGFDPHADSFFDHCLRQAIEHLDEMLESASPATHEECDFCYEVNALLALAENAELRNAIAGAAAHVSSSPATSRVGEADSRTVPS